MAGMVLEAMSLTLEDQNVDVRETSWNLEISENFTVIAHQDS